MVTRVAVVTGGASGIGLATARALAAQGNRVAVLDLDEAGARDAAETLHALGPESVGIAVDVADGAAVEDAFTRVRRELGPVQILVTAAGAARFEPFADITRESWDRMIAVNLGGTYEACHAALPDMVAARWGRIVTISSSSAQRGSPRMAHYAAAKGGVIALTKCLAREYATVGVTVNNIPPSGIETPMQHRGQADGDLPSNETLAAAIPVGYLGGPDDVATAAAFLCTDAARYITGQVVGVNGGAVI